MKDFTDIVKGCCLKGIVPDTAVTVVDCTHHGTDALELTYRTPEGVLGSQLVYRNDVANLEILSSESGRDFNGDGHLFKLVSEAKRIKLAHLFDPLLAVHTSLIEPLPHQITAVYEKMLNKQPLRYLLADDPGSGKTIMAGLLIKELIARGDVQRCLVVCPGVLVEQWQDELWEKFHLPFEIMTNDKFESARTGNWFRECDLIIARLDKLARDEISQQKLENVSWDLVVCDEAHKMSASYFGRKVKRTKRHLLGKLLSQTTRQLLFLTATPHNGKDDDFQLFMSLLDPDRFEGRADPDSPASDLSDIMRRLPKEELLKFDATPLFPERRAYVVSYRLSDAERMLYERVTDYVRSEFNRAEKLDKKRGNTVGFALTILQRRLASSSHAICRSLERRRNKLTERMEELKAGLRRVKTRRSGLHFRTYSEEDLDYIDDLPEEELEDFEGEVIDSATASQTIPELKAEIETLDDLVGLAERVRSLGSDTKWEELRSILLESDYMFDSSYVRRKLVIFTEHRDTLSYLEHKIKTLLGKEDAIVVIHGGLKREDRREAQLQFTQNKDVHILLATDAAGEGINLQRAHLMVNYDLPWNPNRIEQRFGRIHRIGQTEVCHLWNLVAEDTREGDVYQRLLSKLATESKTLGGSVFDVLGKVFRGSELRKLLIDAIRYGDSQEVKDQLFKKVDGAFSTKRLKGLIEEHALARDVMDKSMVMKIREYMERAEAKRLQPHYISSFFREAFAYLGGTIRNRESGRFEITHVPASVINWAKQNCPKDPILRRYERIAFEKDRIRTQGKPEAAFICPGHPLLDGVTGVLLERTGSILDQGSILVDSGNETDDIRVLFVLDHSIQDAVPTQEGSQRVVSRRLQFVEVLQDGNVRNAGYAPYLDYRPLLSSEAPTVERLIEESEWISQSAEHTAVDHAVSHIVPAHLDEVKSVRISHAEKALAAIHKRLTREIHYWDRRAEELRQKEQAGKQPKMNWMKAKEHAEELAARLARRKEELEQEKHVSPQPPRVIGSVVVVPEMLLISSEDSTQPSPPSAKDRRAVELAAMNAVMKAERDLGNEPRDVSDQKLGWDIESRPREEGRLRFIEVKGRAGDADTVTVTKNEILASLNQPDSFILAIVQVDDDSATVSYLRKPFKQEPDFAEVSRNFRLDDLLLRSTNPC